MRYLADWLAGVGPKYLLLGKKLFNAFNLLTGKYVEMIYPMLKGRHMLCIGVSDSKVQLLRSFASFALDSDPYLDSSFVVSLLDLYIDWSIGVSIFLCFWNDLP